jgi:hypothetical protein
MPDGIPARNVEVTAREPDGGARCIHQIVVKRCVFTAARTGIHSCLGSASISNAGRISDAAHVEFARECFGQNCPNLGFLSGAARAHLFVWRSKCVCL